MRLNDTLAQRYDRLAPFIEVYGPDDDLRRPALLMFHGCGGKRPHIALYAEAAASTGIRVFVVDSFAPRQWGRNFAISMVCTGLAFQGYERSGDVLAALWGIRKRDDVDPSRLILFGESHGGWAIMDLMTQKLTRPGEARLADPDPKLLDGVAGLFLVYPYINFPARTNFSGWRYRPRVMTVAAELDHLTPYTHTLKVMDRLKSDGVAVEVLSLNATHAFDETEFSGSIMRYDEAATQRCIEAMLGFIDSVTGLVPQPG
ncbi:MAG: dienelactone hydrolase family protein [Asticcacaulis sp.]